MVGLGVDFTTRQTKLPVVQLTYTDPSKTFTSSVGKTYREPVEAILKSHELTGLFNQALETWIFRTMKVYLR